MEPEVDIRTCPCEICDTILPTVKVRIDPYLSEIYGREVLKILCVKCWEARLTKLHTVLGHGDRKLSSRSELKVGDIFRYYREERSGKVLWADVRITDLDSSYSPKPGRDIPSVECEVLDCSLPDKVGREWHLGHGFFDRYISRLRIKRT